MEFSISDEASLFAACDAMHDADFDLDSASFDPSSGTWSIALQRPDWAQSETTRRLIFNRSSAPIVNAVLSLEGVRAFTVNDRSRIGTHNFDECRSRGEAYQFVFHTDMDFVLEFDGEPSGSLRDGEPAGRTETMWGLGQGS